jgi:hypothetical protein
MYLDKQKVELYIEDMVKIYTDIHLLSEQGGVGIGDSSKYLGKIQALIEFKHYLTSGRFDDEFTKTIAQIIEEQQDVLNALRQVENIDSVKIWVDKSNKM